MVAKKKMTSYQKKIKTVMGEYRSGKLNSGKMARLSEVENKQ